MAGFHAGLPALRGAFVAVDVFFVLSGCFLATSLMRRLATNEEIGVLAVVTRRAWRLLPALIIVVLGTLATTPLYAPIDRAAVAGHVPPVAAFASNLSFAVDGVDYFGSGQNPLLHTWTLGVELQLALVRCVLVVLPAAAGARMAGDATGADRRWMVTRTVVIGVAIAALVSFAVSFGWYLRHLPLMTLGAVLQPEIGPAGKLAWGALGLAAAITHRALESSLVAALLRRASTTRPLIAAAARGVTCS